MRKVLAQALALRIAHHYEIKVAVALRAVRRQEEIRPHVRNVERLEQQVVAGDVLSVQPRSNRNRLAALELLLQQLQCVAHDSVAALQGSDRFVAVHVRDPRRKKADADAFDEASLAPGPERYADVELHAPRARPSLDQVF